MRFLVVYAHPVKESFVSALHDCAVAALRSAGHEVDDCDLYAEGFQPVLSREERIAYHNVGANQGHVAKEIERLRRCDGLVLVYATTAIPFCVWTLKGYFDSMPRELEEAARIDGASNWQIFRRIVLPLARPGLAVTALFSFMTAWNEFIMASTFMTDTNRYTLPVLIQSSVTEHSADYGLFAAGAVVTSIPVMIAFYVLQKYLVGGLTAGAVKG